MPREIERSVVSSNACAFLTHLEQSRKVSTSTRNQRVAALHVLGRFIAEHSHQHVAGAREVRTVPIKKTVRELMSRLNQHEVEVLLAVPDRTNVHRQHNNALLLLCYFTTRVHGPVKLQISVSQISN